MIPLDWHVTKKCRCLDFDIENRPLSYWCPDRPSAEVTAIAWGWCDDPRIEVGLLGLDGVLRGLEEFLEVFASADMVTGHYIRKHDLPIINGMLMEKGMDLLPKKLTCDTRLDLPKEKDLPVSQEALADHLGITIPKIHMTQAMWREANRLTPKGLKLTSDRVSRDVQQHKLIRKELLNRNLLKSPKMWIP